MHRVLVAFLGCLALTSCTTNAPAPSIEAFFDTFTADWVRMNPNQAIDYGIEASEIERYVVNPGQACAYMIGQLTLVELRDKARAALGARFDAKAFHNAVLTMGTAPLTMIKDQVNRHIAAAK